MQDGGVAGEAGVCVPPYGGTNPVNGGNPDAGFKAPGEGQRSVSGEAGPHGDDCDLHPPGVYPVCE